jgi:hypothetical protein
MDETTQAPVDVAPVIDSGAPVAPETVVEPVATAPEVAPVVVDPVPAPVAPTVKTKVRHQRQKQVTSIVTAEELTETEITDDDVDVLPASLTLAAPYAFYDDAGAMHQWLAGQTVADATEIALLVDRGAIFKAE